MFGRVCHLLVSFVTLQSGESETTCHDSSPPSDGISKASVLSVLITSSVASLSHNTHFALGLFYSLTNPCETIRHGEGGEGGIQLRAKTLIVSRRLQERWHWPDLSPCAAWGRRKGWEFITSKGGFGIFLQNWLDLLFQPLFRLTHKVCVALRYEELLGEWPTIGLCISMHHGIFLWLIQCYIERTLETCCTLKTLNQRLTYRLMNTFVWPTDNSIFHWLAVVKALAVHHIS